MRKIKADKIFLFIVIILSIVGFGLFYSASLSLVESGANSESVVKMQGIGLIVGIFLMLVVSKIPYRYWKNVSIILFLIAIVINLVPFIPGLGMEHGGAIRWIKIGSFTFQPSEFLKIAFILILARYLDKAKDRITDPQKALIPFFFFSAVVGILLYLQKDTDTMLVILISGISMLFVAGVKIKHLGLIFLSGIILGSALIASRPYIIQRIHTYLNPASDPTGAGYQIQQSLIAIGSGGMFGRGLGQSLQKFGYLPEPIGDSVFAVGAEEFGFAGAVTLVILYFFLLYRGLIISRKAPDNFARLVVVGIVILVVVESYLNIGSMLGMIPLSGMPLLFVSHGGTALMLIIAQMGIILNISSARISKSNIKLT